jgi:hypothetical protein
MDNIFNFNFRLTFFISIKYNCVSVQLYVKRQKKWSKVGWTKARWIFWARDWPLSWISPQPYTCPSLDSLILTQVEFLIPWTWCVSSLVLDHPVIKLCCLHFTWSTVVLTIPSTSSLYVHLHDDTPQSVCHPWSVLWLSIKAPTHPFFVVLILLARTHLIFTIFFDCMPQCSTPAHHKKRKEHVAPHQLT